MILKGRLKLIYDMIPPCGVLSDIGTDHAFIPAKALLDGRCKRAIACDVKKGPLERADRTRKEYRLEDYMELRLGSGLEPITEDEADCVVLAGMGGILIAELIETSIEKAKKARCLVLQPMIGQEILRPFLWQNGFEVLDEGLTKEGNKLYQVISAKYTGQRREHWDRMYEYIGEHLITKRDPLLPEWLEDRLTKQQKVVKGLNEAKTADDILVRKETDLLLRLTDLHEALKEGPGCLN